MRKRAKEALLTPVKIKWRGVGQSREMEDRERERREGRQRREMEDREKGWKEGGGGRGER